MEKLFYDNKTKSFYTEEVTVEELENSLKNKKEQEKAKRLIEIDAELRSLDYIGVKIATGRGTREEYATQIARMQELAEEKNRILAE